MATSSMETPIIVHHLRSLYFSFFLRKGQWEKERKEEDTDNLNALKTGDFVYVYPLLFCLFSLFSLS